MVSIRRALARLFGVTDSEALTSQPLNEQSLKEGNSFTHREEFSVGDGDTTEILLRNEVDRDVRLYVEDIDADAEIVGTESYNAAVSATGTAIDAVNRLLQDPIDQDSPLGVYANGTYDTTAGSQDVLPSNVLATGNGSASALETQSAPFRLQPNTNIVLSLTAQNAGTKLEVEFIASERPTV
jgi:hypothetical protein